MKVKKPSVWALTLMWALGTASMAQARAGARLNGVVMNLRGRPRSGLIVRVYQPQGDRRDTPVGETKTDRSGRFSFRNLPPGLLDLKIFRGGQKLVTCRVRIERRRSHSVEIYIHDPGDPPP